jgi:uncharacterized protein (TIGR02265 family)
VLAKSIPPPNFVPARSGVTVDLDAHLKIVPAKAACKGMFFADLFKMVEGKATPEEIATRAGVQHRRYVSFVDYPYTDLLKLTVEVAKIAHPKLPTGDAIRLIGRRCYFTLLGSQVGRVLLMSLGMDAEKVFLAAPKACRIVLNFGRFSAERVGERHVRFVCEGYPSFLESYHVGAIEGCLEHFGDRGEVRIALKDLGTATFDITWEPKVS